MKSKQDSHHPSALMALNGWSIEDILTFSEMLNLPHDVTAQLIEGYITRHRTYQEGGVAGTPPE
ncbi:hypothetical protein [Neptunomonas antarctica]|uniref:Uncharacterized protein n=1 Tax=Neptunomonas antarctica TaxID=619304 RepID=A0A1N7L096_9GAMM|nr:hypothetical protein [Neptunomonas antarctica]SIS67241.1 hypothetical protein SAMN05421760_103114 [Neptunomonas antarctica]